MPQGKTTEEAERLFFSGFAGQLQRAANAVRALAAAAAAAAELDGDSGGEQHTHNGMHTHKSLNRAAGWPPVGPTAAMLAAADMSCLALEKTADAYVAQFTSAAVSGAPLVVPEPRHAFEVLVGRLQRLPAYYATSPITTTGLPRQASSAGGSFAGLWRGSAAADSLSKLCFVSASGVGISGGIKGPWKSVEDEDVEDEDEAEAEVEAEWEQQQRRQQQQEEEPRTRADDEAATAVAFSILAATASVLTALATFHPEAAATHEVDGD
eukprot:SAG22_NODE_1208_length_5164_cov_10.104442_3_plen_267_part_00